MGHAMRSNGGRAVRARSEALLTCRRSHEEAPDDGSLVAGDVGGGEQLGERLAEVIHLLVQAPDVAARILQHPRRRTLLHSFPFTSSISSRALADDLIRYGWVRGRTPPDN